MTTAPYTDIDFVLSSSDGRGDFIGISGSGLDKAGIGVFTCESGSINFLSKSAGTILNVYNGPYQYASWQQTRNLYNPIVRKLAKSSVLSLAQTTIPVGPEGQQVRSMRGGVTCYKEPVVSDNARPITHILEVQPNINQPTITTSSFTYTHDNNLLSFAHTGIREELGINISGKDSIYKNISQLYLDLAEINSNTNPVRKFVELDYTQVLYPAATNAYLNRTRSRINYKEVPGIGPDGYDRIFGHQRTFFKENEIRNIGVALNSQGYASGDPGFAIAHTSSFTDDGILPSEYFWKDAASGLVCIDESAFEAGGAHGCATSTAAARGPWAFRFGFLAEVPGGTVGGGEFATPAGKYLEWKDTILDNPSTNLVTVNFKVMALKSSDYPITCPRLLYPRVSPDPGVESLNVQYRVEGADWVDFDTAGFTGGSTIDTTCWTSITASTALGAGIGAKIRIATTSSLDWFEPYFVIQSLRISGFQGANDVDFLNFNPMATDGIRSFPQSSSYRNYDGELMGDTDESMFGGQAQPSMAFTEQTHIANESGTFAVLSDYVERLTEQISGKDPWYNTYGKYEEDLRGAAKGMSLVPEFRMSDFVEYYLIDQGGNFRARNDKFLLLDGGSITASAAFESSSIDSNFISEHVDTSRSHNFQQIAAEHADISNMSRLELTCKGIKKLLPYNGFYPANRTIQLGNLLSQSMGPHITGSKDNLVSPDYYPQALQGLLKPLVSPGILYNSIKSGIAVDYPIYTGEVPGLVVSGDDTPSDFVLSNAPNYRLPFESLLNLKGAMPEGSNHPITLVSSFATFVDGLSTEDLFRYAVRWSGEKSSLFELGMHNFLAETVDFFLEDGKLTSYKSEVQPDGGWEFEPNKTYYMDVVLRDTVQMNKFAEYYSQKIITRLSKFSGRDVLPEKLLMSGTSDAYVWQPEGENLNVPYGSRFGWDVDMVEGDSGDLWALVGAPLFAKDRGTAFLFHNKMDSNGWTQIQQFTASNGLPAGVFLDSDDQYGSSFGKAVSLVSSSDDMWCLIGAPGQSDYEGSPNSQYGAAYLFQSSSAKSRAGATNGWTETITQSMEPEEDAQYGAAVSLSSGSDGLWCLVGEPYSTSGEGGPYADCGKAFLYKQANAVALVTTGTFEHKLTLTASDPHVYLGFGGGVAVWAKDDLVQGDRPDGVMTAIGARGQTGYGLGAGETGVIYLYRHLDFYPTPGIYGANGYKNRAILSSSYGAGSSPPCSVSDMGQTIAMDSGSDGLYILAGAPFTDVLSITNAGSLHLFHSQSLNDEGPVYEQMFTSSIAEENAYLGYGTIDVVSGSDGIYFGGGTSTPLPSGVGGHALMFFSASAFQFVIDEQIIYPDPSGSTTDPELPGKADGFGQSVAMVSSSRPDSAGLYVCVGEPTGSFYVSGSGAAYLFTGSIQNRTLTSSLVYAQIGQAYRQDGKLFGMALEEDYDPAYCAYTPPCMYGEAIARLSFKTDALGGTYTLDEILGNAEIENILTVDSNRVAVTGGVAQSLTGLQDDNKMPVGASVNMFGKYLEPQVTMDATTGDGETVTQNSANKPSWVISSRFESPVLDTINPRYRQLYTSFNPLITGTFVWEPREIVDLFENHRANGIAIDERTRKIYWCDTFAYPDEVARSNLDGTDIEVLISLGVEDPTRIALDTSHAKMYYSTSNPTTAFWSASLDGEGAWELYDAISDPGPANGSSDCRGMALDSQTARKIYWTDFALDAIFRIPMENTGSDGPIAAELIIDGAGIEAVEKPSGIALDVVNGMMYWCMGPDTTNPRICRAPMDGTGSGPLEVLASLDNLPSMISPRGIALDLGRREIYWTDTGADQICRVGMDNEPCCRIPEILFSPPGAGNNLDIALDFSTRDMFFSDFGNKTICTTRMDLYDRIDPRTVWSSYGSIPKGDKGVYMEIKESFPDVLAQNSSTTGSLIDKCGFTIPLQEKMKVGKVRGSKEISEAVVAIPYFENVLFQKQVGTELGEVETKELTVSLKSGGIEGRNFVRIPDLVYNGTKANLEKFGVAVPADQNPINSGVEVKNTTVSEMIKMMKKYIIPPNLDFVKYDGTIPPFVMYVFEFNHTLEQQELTDIWQGVTPESALKMENGEVVISHGFSQFQFFGNILDKKVLGDMKFLIFKVKKRGKYNYYELTKDSTDDSKFNFTFQGNPIESAVDLGGSYNWPYDFFSLVEEATVEAKFTLKNKPPPVPISEDEE